MQFKYDVCLHDTIVHVAYKLYRMHVVRMMPAQLATRSTHLTENSEASCLSENVQRQYFTSVAQPRRKEEEDYKLWPANKSDRSWQSLSNPAKRHSFVSNQMSVTSG